MGDTLFGRHSARLALIAALAVVAAGAIVWVFFGSRLFPPDDETVSRLISEHWLEIFYDRNSPDTGPDGNVTVVAFLDYDSADCRKVAAALDQLHESDGGVRIVFKELGDPGSPAEVAARASIAATRQDLFLPLNRELIRGPDEITESSVITAAKQAGLDTDRLRADMKDPPISKAIEQNRTLARALGITPPAMIVRNRIVRDATDLKALEAVVAQARALPPL